MRLCAREQFSVWNSRIAPADTAAAARAKKRWDSIAKPLGGLGKLETDVIRIAALTGSENVSIEKRRVVVLCADNGVVEEGVTQTDSSVTSVMAERILSGRSAVCRMAETARASVVPVDVGMLRRAEGVRDLCVGRGTGNIAKGPAMTEEQGMRAIENGILLAAEAAGDGVGILLTGEMGIGNTTTSSAVAKVLLGMPAESVTGRGAGLSDEGLLRKRAAILRAVEINRPDPKDAFDTAVKLGGFDILGMTGLYIGSALNRIPAVIDGFPSSVAALIAARLVPNCRTAMLASHCSAEPAAEAILKELDLKAVLYADMKLGEGTGAVCLLPLLDAALAVYNGSASFSETGIDPYVSQGGERI